MQQLIQLFFVNLEHAKKSLNYDWLIINNYLMLIRWMQHYSYIYIYIYMFRRSMQQFIKCFCVNLEHATKFIKL